MFLIVDIGNSNITFGLVKESEIIRTFRLKSDIHISYEETIKELFSDIEIKGCLIASVVKELSDIIKQAIDNIFKINSVFLNKNQIDVGINIRTPNPEEAGADRIANAYAAKTLYGFPAIVVDMGTATTFEILDENGDFVGGIIMPGIKTQLKSLCGSTSLLPDIEPAEIDSVIGDNTISNILSGVVRGHACAVDGLLKECKKELGLQNIRIIGTGGFIKLISKYMDEKFDDVNINLTLEGIRLIYEKNALIYN